MKIQEYFDMEKWEDMYNFLGKNYREDLPLRSQKIYEWQFQVKKNHGKGNMICAWDGDSLVGILGYMPSEVLWGDFNKPLNGVWSINWMVDEKYRHGIGWLLMRKLQEMFSIVFGTDATEENLRLIKHADWRFYPALPRYISILNIDKSLQMLNKDFSAKNIKSFLFKRNGNEEDVLFVDREQESKFESFNLDWQHYPSLAYGTIRSKDYLVWRYLNHPALEYTIAIKGESKRPAVCVYRIEQTFGEYKALVGRVVEFFHPNDAKGRKDGLGLINTVLHKLEKAGCAYVDFICSSMKYGETLLNSGFGMEPVDNQILPVRLTPVEQKKHKYSIEIGAGKEISIPPLGNLYVTKGDGDMDRAAQLKNFGEI